jgi:hypothetical protein
MKSGRFELKIDPRLKEAFEKRVAALTTDSLAEIVRAGIFYMMSLSDDELRQFLAECRRLELLYWERYMAENERELAEMKTLMQMVRDAGLSKDEIAALFAEHAAQKK